MSEMNTPGNGKLKRAATIGGMLEHYPNLRSQLTDAAPTNTPYCRHNPHNHLVTITEMAKQAHCTIKTARARYQPAAFFLQRRYWQLIPLYDTRQIAALNNDEAQP